MATAPRPFDGLAEQYDRRDELTGDPLGRWLECALPSRGGTAVDLACGTGRHAVVLAERYEHVLAVDLSDDMIALARRRRARANVEYRRDDLMSVAGRFDLVLCAAALHDLPDREGVLRHIRGLVADGGRAIVADVTAERWAQWCARRFVALWFRGGALVHLLVGLASRRPGARERFALDRDPAWVEHLATDRYLTRAEFDRLCTAALPAATLTTAGHLRIAAWQNSG